MSAAIDFQFLQPMWLLLLPPLWTLLWIYARRARRRSAWARICDTHLLARMTSSRSMASGSAAVVGIFGGLFTLGIIAAAVPSWSRASSPVLETNSARVIALDLSRSMLVEDVRPSRYGHAVAAASELIGDGFDGETGLVVFAGSAFVLSPLSRDADTLQAFVEAVHPDTMPRDGVNLGRAIASAQQLLAASLSGRGQILLISAGDSRDENAVRSAATAAELGHRVSVLAIGSSAGGPLLDPQGGLLRDDSGSIRLSKSNLALLQRVAVAGRGSMAIATSDIGGGDLLTSRLQASRLLEAVEYSNEADDDGVWIPWLMLPLALLLFRKNILLLLVLALFAPIGQDVYASEPDAFWEHAERVAFDAYQRGDFETAIESSKNPLLRGASFYRRGQYRQALEQFSADDSASGFFNRANALLQLQRYGEALEAYGQALARNPKHDRARYNRRLLQTFLEQQAATETDKQSSDDPEDYTSNNDARQTSEMVIGIGTEMNNNPADEQQLGPGTGAGGQAGQVDPMERFDGSDSEQGRFELRARGPGQAPQAELIERWISALPETSTELYRRKFLRDYHRQQRQPR